MEQRPTGIDWHAGGGTGTVRFGEDKNLLVMFYNRSMPVASASLDKGRRIHKDVIFIKIQQPGEMLNIIDRPANDEDKHRFRTQWANFVHDRTQVPEGSPIDLLFPNHPAVADNLRAFGIFTIEQCAELSAHAMDTIGRGSQEYVNRAKKYLDAADKGVAFHKLQKENDDLRQAMRIQENQIKQLKDQFDSLNTRMIDPVRASLQPPFIPGVDPQTDRINNNAPTKELSEKVQRNRGRRAQSVEDQITNPLSSMNNPDINVTEGQDA